VEAGEQVLFEEDRPSFALVAGRTRQAPAARNETPPPVSRPRPKHAEPDRAERKGRRSSDHVSYDTSAAAAADGRAELAQVEAQIDALEKRKDAIIQMLNDPESYRDSSGLPLKEYGEVEKELAGLYARWESVAEHAAGTRARGEKPQP
jgi:hypothetical protein